MALLSFAREIHEVAIFPPGLTEKSSVPVEYYQIDLKNTLRIDYKQRLPCLSRLWSEFGIFFGVVTSISGLFLSLTVKN
jgi:hypothetical protein